MLASFPGSISACVLERQQCKSSVRTLHGQDHAALDTSTHCLMSGQNHLYPPCISFHLNSLPKDFCAFHKKLGFLSL